MDNTTGSQGKMGSLVNMHAYNQYSNMYMNVVVVLWAKDYIQSCALAKSL